MDNNEEILSAEQDTSKRIGEQTTDKSANTQIDDDAPSEQANGQQQVKASASQATEKAQADDRPAKPAKAATGQANDKPAKSSTASTERVKRKPAKAPANASSDQATDQPAKAPSEQSVNRPSKKAKAPTRQLTAGKAKATKALPPAKRKSKPKALAASKIKGRLNAKPDKASSAKPKDAAEASALEMGKNAAAAAREKASVISQMIKAKPKAASAPNKPVAQSTTAQTSTDTVTDKTVAKEQTAFTEPAEKATAKEQNAPKADVKAAPTDAKSKPDTGVETPSAKSNTGSAKHIAQPEPPATFGERVDAVKAWFASNAKTPKVIVPAVLLVLYICGSLFFMSHYLPGTTVNGYDVSWGTIQAAVAPAKNEEDGYAVKVEGDGLDLSIKGSDVAFAFDDGSFSQSAQAHMPGWTWPIALILPRSFEVTEGVSYDAEKLEGLVSKAVDTVNEKATYPQNATRSYDKSKEAFVTTEEKGGTAVSHDSALESITRGVTTLQEHVELGDDELVKPALVQSSPNMDAAISRAEEVSNLSIELTVKGVKAATVEPELIRSWITLDDSYNVVGDIDRITEWTRGDLSAEVDTIATARTYTRTSDGKRIEVYGGGTYGWNVDGIELAEVIAQHIADNSSESIEIPMQSKAEVYVHGKQDWGPRYLDVDLTEQYVRFFDENSKIIMESECVSGDVIQNNQTVTGVFVLEDKKSPEILIGNDDNYDGEPDYENEVQYWMPFFGGYGLHDALWRDYFGADVYQYSGSHGCVNLPYYAAEQLYGLIKIGDVVVVHY